VKTEAGVKGKQLFMPIRVAVIGQPHGAELKILVPLLPKSSLLKRVETAISRLK
ncbi:MAG: glutamate--tRNA ligase, partial [Bdellovibrionota bacterium]